MVDDVDPEVTTELVNRVLKDLADLITSSSYSIFPLDIQTTHDVISTLLELVFYPVVSLFTYMCVVLLKWLRIYWKRKDLIMYVSWHM